MLPDGGRPSRTGNVLTSCSPLSEPFLALFSLQLKQRLKPHLKQCYRMSWMTFGTCGFARGRIDRAFTLTGKVHRIDVAPDGRGFLFDIVGSNEESEEHTYRMKMAVLVDIQNGGAKGVILGHGKDVPGLYEEDVVTISGRFIGHLRAENRNGVVKTAPFIDATTITKNHTKRE